MQPAEVCVSVSTSTPPSEGKNGRTSPQETFDRFERHGFEVVHARLSAGVQHRELARDLVARERVVRGEFARFGHDVEVGQRGLDHQKVGTLGDVAELSRRPIPIVS